MHAFSLFTNKKWISSPSLSLCLCLSFSLFKLLTLFFVKYLFPNSLVNLCADHVFCFGQFSLFKMGTFFSSLVEWYNEKRLNRISLLFNYDYVTNCHNRTFFFLFVPDSCDCAALIHNTEWVKSIWIHIAYGGAMYAQASEWVKSIWIHIAYGGAMYAQASDSILRRRF